MSNKERKALAMEKLCKAYEEAKEELSLIGLYWFDYGYDNLLDELVNEKYFSSKKEREIVALVTEMLFNSLKEV